MHLPLWAHQLLAVAEITVAVIVGFAVIFGAVLFVVIGGNRR